MSDLQLIFLRKENEQLKDQVRILTTALAESESDLRIAHETITALEMRIGGFDKHYEGDEKW